MVRSHLMRCDALRCRTAPRGTARQRNAFSHRIRREEAREKSSEITTCAGVAYVEAVLMVYRRTAVMMLLRRLDRPQYDGIISWRN